VLDIFRWYPRSFSQSLAKTQGGVMRKNITNIFWGVLLILLGGVALAQQLGYIDLNLLAPTTWVWISAGLGLVFLVGYFIAGLKEWGWLFPAFILEAIAVVIFWADTGVQETHLGAPIFIAVALPFVVAFLLDFRKNWWALIPAFACSVMAVLVIFMDELGSDALGALMMYAVAFPFLLVYLLNRSQRWALIPALATGAIGTLSLLNTANTWVSAIIILVISVPFFFVYFTRPRHWWALIPAGILASIGVNALLSNPVFGKFSETSIPGAVLFLGWAITFHALWRRRETLPTAWAQIPALIALIVATVLLVVSAFSEIGLIALLFIGGAALIFLGLRPKKDKSG
jgi:hypothetical protein